MTRKINLKRWQSLVLALVGLILAYALASRAIDTGSWWEYFGTLILLIVSIRLITHGIRAKRNDQ